MLSHPEIAELTALRRRLHQFAELSGSEVKAAGIIEEYLAGCNPDKIITGLGGHGLAVVFDGNLPGPVVLFRAELDALPIQELNSFDYKSLSKDISHKCGHDGHMAILCGLGSVIAKQRPFSGKAILLFQSDEENGKGAARILADQRFTTLNPNIIFALHNFPGYPEGQIVVKHGLMFCASRGMRIILKGKTSHAAYPENGLSPQRAMCRILDAFETLSLKNNCEDEFSMLTIVFARLGEEAFGVTPGFAEIGLTLRAADNNVLRELSAQAEQIVRDSSRAHQITYDIIYQDEFAATINDEYACKFIEDAALASGLPVNFITLPFRASEDFGNFTTRYEGAIFGLGAGEDHPQLHRPDYDFPDMLIEKGVLILFNIFRLCQEYWSK